MCFTLFHGKEKAAEHRRDAAPTMTEHKSSPAVSPMKTPAEAGMPATSTEKTTEEATAG